MGGIVNQIITYLKDRYFDIPNSHQFKNGVLDILFKYQTINHVPDIDRTHRNYYMISNEPLIIITTEHTKDIQLFSRIIGEEIPATFIVSFWWTLFDRHDTIRQIFSHYYIRHFTVSAFSLSNTTFVALLLF